MQRVYCSCRDRIGEVRTSDWSMDRRTVRLGGSKNEGKKTVNKRN